MKLVFEDEALEWIAEEALKRDTGARALRAIMEEFMLDIMYEVPKDPGIGTVVITRNYLEKHGINATVRREMGRDINGACGQLRKSFLEEEEKGG